MYTDQRQKKKMCRQFQDKTIKCIDDTRQKYKMYRQIQDQNKKKCVDRSKTTKWIKAKGMNNLTMMRNLCSYRGKTTTD